MNNIMKRIEGQSKAIAKSIAVLDHKGKLLV